MSIYSNENIRKIAKLIPCKFPHLVQNREKYLCAKIMAYTVVHSCDELVCDLKKQEPRGA